jgi:hypothetical protein
MYQAMQDRFMSEIQWLIMYCCLCIRGSLTLCFVFMLARVVQRVQL